jgi:acyl-[acyl-carrier-protein]-phospholipid O-acyltransferase/long-chain-fatty-acid--[acyl-carrier-protein] ligase
VAAKSGAKLVPLRIAGAECSKFSYISNLIRTRMFPHIKLHLMPPCRINLPENISVRERRRLTSLQLHDIMANMLYDTTPKDIPLFNSLLSAEKQYGGKHKIALDIMKKTLTYSQFLCKTYVLGVAYKKAFRQTDKVGLLLPNSLAGVVSFFALHCAAKIPVMLNFSLGDKQFAACIQTTALTHVVTARKFIEQGNLQRLENILKQHNCQIIYLENLAANLSLFTKLKGLKKYWLREQVSTNPQNPAAILFTSGSEGLPKAVLLSHRNIQANVLQIHLAVPFHSQDVILNALPMFHSFGLTVGTILPLLNGVKTYFYPSPLHYRIIPEVAYDIQATAVLGTDTFLYGYGRMANPYDFFPVRFAVVGGEKLKTRTLDLWLKKFGVRIFEGYGATETSPVISVNTPMFYREGSVGRFLPRIEHRLQPINGVTQGGRLEVKGDNIMLGYMLADCPNTLQPANEWYDTGDIVTIDSDGFISIEGRAKRFAKIGGEMVSLTAVEQLLDTLYPDAKQGIVVVEDEKKGEKLVFITSVENADAAQIRRYFQEQGVSELWIPREVVYMKNPPLLGSGKFDYQTAAELIKNLHS